MASLSSPPAWRTADDGCERSTERRLIGEACLQRHFREGTLRACEEPFGPFDALQDEVAVWRCSKRLPERFRKMTDGQATLRRQAREAERPVEMFGQQFGRAALLPRRETATVLPSGVERRCVGLRDVRAEQETKMIEKELGE